MKRVVLFVVAVTAFNMYSAETELSFKVQPAITGRSAPSEKGLVYFMDGVASYNNEKYAEAYKNLSKVGDVPYLESYIKYYKALTIFNNFNDESNLKKGLSDLCYVIMSSSVLSEQAKDKFPAFEMKLSKAMADNKHCKDSLSHYSIARAHGLSDVDKEFELVKVYANKCDRKVALSLFMDIYARHDQKTLKLINDLDEPLRADLKLVIESWQKTQVVTALPKPVVQGPDVALFDSIKVAMDAKDYSKFVKLSKEYLRSYATSSKQLIKFHSSFNGFIEESLLAKTHTVSYFEGIFSFYEKDQLEKTLFKIWQNEDWNGAEELLDMMIDKFPGYDKAYYLKGSIYEDRVKYSRAYDAYNYVTTHFPSGRYYAPALFKLAWIKMLQGQDNECADIFGRYINEGGDNYDWAITSAYYFRSKCLQKQSKNDDAQKVKQELISKYPFAFYSLLAMDELGMKIPEELDARVQPQNYASEPVSARELNALNTAVKLVRCGLNEYAKKELNYLDLDKLPAEYVEAVSKLYVLAGFHELAMQSSTALLSRLKVFVSREHVEYHFPKHYFDFVKNYAEKMEVDPFLIMAVMKRESAFNKDAVSRSGALGLMQLMPNTAARFQPSIKNEKIKDTDTNIKLAAMYLKELVKRYNGNLAYAAAAYNGGEEALDRWLKWYGGRLAGTEFIENIPYSETRSYVKSVLGNYFMYNAVYLNKHVTFDEVVKGGL